MPSADVNRKIVRGHFAKVAPPNRDLFGTDYAGYLAAYTLYREYVANAKVRWGESSDALKQSQRGPTRGPVGKKPKPALSPQRRASRAAKKARNRARRAQKVAAGAAKLAETTAKVVKANVKIVQGATTLCQAIPRVRSTGETVVESHPADFGWRVVVRRPRGKGYGSEELTTPGAYYPAPKPVVTPAPSVPSRGTGGQSGGGRAAQRPPPSVASSGYRGKR
jgi:hypothetical protein